MSEQNPPAEEDRALDDPDDEAGDEAVDEAVDEADEESFPASDSPSSWSGPPTASR